MIRTPAAKAGDPGFDSWQLPWDFPPSSCLTNLDRTKDLWCSSTVQLLSTQDMNGKTYGAPVQFGCYQHRKGSVVL